MASALLSVPVGAVLMYYAEVQAETLPSTYAYCQGQTLLKSSGQHDLPGADSLLVPDLRNRYLIGADRTKSNGNTGTTANNATGAPGPATNVGLNTHTIAIANLPDHTHSASMGTGVQVDLTTPETSHTHTITISANAGIAHTHSMVGGGYVLSSSTLGGTVTGRAGLGSGTQTFPTSTQSGTSAGGTHTHTITLTAGGAHSHAVTVNNTGVGAGFDGRPYSFGLVHIMKVTAAGLLSYPLKTILAFRADQANETLPDGFAWCDGTLYNSAQQDVNPGGNFTTPNLKNRFIIGADVVNKVASTTGAIGDLVSDSPGVKAAFGTQSHTVTTGEMATHTHDPSISTVSNHDHGATIGASSSSGNHSHGTGCHTYMRLGLVTQNDGGNNGTILVYEGGSISDLNTTGAHVHSGTTSSSGAHYHAISVSNAGSATPYDKRPLFHGVVFAIKIRN